MVGEQLHIMYIYGDLCSVFHYVMLIFLNSVESELIYVENKGGHWRRVCDIYAQLCSLCGNIFFCVLYYHTFQLYCMAN